MDIHGSYFDSRSSRRREALLRDLTGGPDGPGGKRRLGVYDAGGTLLAEADAGTLRISSRVGNTPRFLRFPDGSVFETNENDAVDRLAGTLSPRAGLAYRLESRLRYAAIGLVVTILFTWATVQYGIPFCARVAAFAISAENNRRIGQGVLDLLDKTIFSPSQLPLVEQERLRRRFLDFIGAVDGIPLDVEFRHGNDRIGANALTLPSGAIVFTDQLVQLAENDEELLGIFSHEAGHVARRHAMRGILQQSALAAVVAAVTGDVSSVATLVTAAPVFLMQTGYSRDFEREADDFAVARLQEGGIGPLHFANLLARLEASRPGQDGKDGKDSKSVQNQDHSPLNDYLSTHPATAERLQRIQGQHSPTTIRKVL